MTKRKKPKALKSYIAEVEQTVEKEYGGIPDKLRLIIRKTAMDMRMLDQITDTLDLLEGDFTSIEVGSTGQQKTVVNPLIPYYDKYSSRVTDDLYNLGLTARRQAVKAEDPADKKPEDKLNELINSIR